MRMTVCVCLCAVFVYVIIICTTHQRTPTPDQMDSVALLSSMLVVGHPASTNLYSRMWTLSVRRRRRGPFAHSQCPRSPAQADSTANTLRIIHGVLSYTYIYIFTYSSVESLVFWERGLRVRFCGWTKNHCIRMRIWNKFAHMRVDIIIYVIHREALAISAIDRLHFFFGWILMLNEMQTHKHNIDAHEYAQSRWCKWYVLIKSTPFFRSVWKMCDYGHMCRADDGVDATTFCRTNRWLNENCIRWWNTHIHCTSWVKKKTFVCLEQNIG